MSKYKHYVRERVQSIGKFDWLGIRYGSVVLPLSPLPHPHFPKRLTPSRGIKRPVPLGPSDVIARRGESSPEDKTLPSTPNLPTHIACYLIEKRQGRQGTVVFFAVLPSSSLFRIWRFCTKNQCSWGSKSRNQHCLLCIVPFIWNFIDIYDF